MKNVLIDKPRKRIHKIQFGCASGSDIVKQSVVRVNSRDLYTINERNPAQNGALDLRMGVSEKERECETCHQRLADCVGHFGFVELALPVFHIGYMRHILRILQTICKDCGNVLIDDIEKRKYAAQLHKRDLDNLMRAQIAKRITDTAKKQRKCQKCNTIQGVVKKAGPLKIIHERFRYAKKSDADLENDFSNLFTDAIADNPDIKPHLGRACDDMNPLRVLMLFQRIKSADVDLLGIDPHFGRPENFLWQYVPAPPVCIRPSILQDGASTEDDITVKLTEITWTSNLIKNAIESGTPIVHLMEQWDYLQLLIAQYVNAETPGLRASDQSNRPIRGFCQRLKGKQGRFRGNLSGKRVDFSARTVISPDPNLPINAVAVPEHIAKILTYPERVTSWNRDRLKKVILNGPEKWPGANNLIHKDNNGVEQRRFLKFGNRRQIAKSLKIGDVVERHLIDNDVVLFNRQPSLHKLSIMAHFVKVRPWKTFRLNECVCGSFNADFDGDEMNLHVPQTEEARAEALCLMGVKENLVTPKNGEPIIAATQDFITGAYLLSQKDRFYTKRDFMNICCAMVDANMHIDIPKPSIVKPVELWTGKQIFSVLIRPNKKSKVLLNLESKTRTYHATNSTAPEMSLDDGYLIVHNSEVLCGVVDKSIVGDGRKMSIFYAILKDYGSDEAAAAMNRLAKLCARNISEIGVSIGISDVQPGQQLRLKKDQIVDEAYKVSDDYIFQLAKGTLETQPGMDREETLESKISSTLSKVRDDCGAICMSELDRHNAALIMANCGSKGSKINVSQMVACVGQQIISGKRVPDGFQDRSLPHFPKRSKHPPSKGFVRNSFYSGLNPSECYFHAISGREGLVDTAVKTAETGYMSRRLMKALEDLSVRYDGTVRSSDSSVVQFTYGEDGLDPTYLEGNGVPVEFTRLWRHCSLWLDWKKHKDISATMLNGKVVTNNASSSENNSNSIDKDLFPEEIMRTCEDILRSKKFSQNCTEMFLKSVRNFIQNQIVSRLQLLYKRFNYSAAGFQEDKAIIDKILRVTKDQLELFLESCWHRYMRAKVEPGTAIGAIGAQSIGEPGTQMTLKTFHFAGVAAMTTLGVPRIKEIINASKLIQTPVIRCKLVEAHDIESARRVKGRIEKTYVRDIARYVEDAYGQSSCYIGLKIDFETVQALQLEVTLESIAAAIEKSLKLQARDLQVIYPDKIRIYVDVNNAIDEHESMAVFMKIQSLKRAVPRVIVSGIPNVNRAIINQLDSGEMQLIVEGYGLRDVMSTRGVVGSETVSNHVMEVREVLGIEAARQCIISEVDFTMASHGLDIDPRHLMLLGDVMTSKGDVLGITRFGISKMKDSVLMLASFEKTTDHLFDAAARLAMDAIEGVSERIIMGIPMTLGTGSFQLIRRNEINTELPPRELMFDRSLDPS